MRAPAFNNVFINESTLFRCVKIEFNEIII